VNWTLIGLIVVTLAATVLESVPRLAAQYGEAFEAIEYAARLWTAIEHPRWRRFGAIRSRLSFAASPAGLIDLVAVLPFWLSLVVAADFRAFLVLRLIRFFKLTRYSPAMRSLLEALYTERLSAAS
jgi:voltage-gated potassium channel